MNAVTLEQVGVMQEVSKAKEAFNNSGVRYCEQRDVINRIRQTGGSFNDCLLEEARIWASQLTAEDVEYWDGELPLQFHISEAQYFFGWVASRMSGWSSLMKEVWNA